MDQNGSPGRILYVEDEMMLQKLVSLSLTRGRGWLVHCCSVADQALNMAREVTPDLIMLDVVMPEMSGEEVFAVLRADPVARDIPVIFLSARSSAEDVDRYMALGAIGVIAKPINPMSLADRIEKIWVDRLNMAK